MYQLKRADRIKEEIMLGDETLTIDLDAQHLAVEFNKRRNSLIRAEQAMKGLRDGAASDTMFEQYGNAVISVFDLVFGEENTKKIVEFYEGRYVEMSLEVFPFIRDVITPKMSAAMESLRKSAAKQKYTNRRRFG